MMPPGMTSRGIGGAGLQIANLITGIRARNEDNAYQQRVLTLQEEQARRQAAQADREALTSGVATLGELARSGLPEPLQQYAIGKLGDQLGLPADMTKAVLKMGQEDREGLAELLQSTLTNNPNLGERSVRLLSRGDPLKAIQEVGALYKSQRALISSQALQQLMQQPGPIVEPPGVGTPAPEPGRQSSLTPLQQQIAQEAEARGIPAAVALAQVQQESGFETSAVGKAGEIGLFQILPSTGAELGYTPEQLRDPTTNIRAGLDYLKRHITERGGIAPGLQRYNGGGDKNYVANVLRNIPRFTQALTEGGAMAPPVDTRRVQARIDQIDAITQRITSSPAVQQGDQEVERVLTRLDRERQNLVQERDRQTTLATARTQQAATELGMQRTRQEVAKEQRQVSGTLIPAEQLKVRLDVQNNIRQEQTIKAFNDARPGYQLMQEAERESSGLGDLALVKAFERTINPGNAVLQSEATTIQDAQGYLQRFFQIPAQFFTGERLKPEFREAILKVGKAQITRLAQNADTQVRTIYQPIAAQAGIPFDQLYVPAERLLTEKPVSVGDIVRNAPKGDKESLEKILKDIPSR